MSGNHEYYVDKYNIELDSFKEKYIMLFESELMTPSLARYIDHLDTIVLNKMKVLYRSYYESIIRAYRDFKYLYNRYTEQYDEQTSFARAFDFHKPYWVSRYETKEYGRNLFMLYKILTTDYDPSNEDILLIKICIERESNICKFLNVPTDNIYKESSIDFNFINVDRSILD